MREKIQDIIYSNLNEYIGENEAILHASEDIEERMIGFAEWCTKNYTYKGEGVWFNMHTIEHTTKELLIKYEETV